MSYKVASQRQWRLAAASMARLGGTPPNK